MTDLTVHLVVAAAFVGLIVGVLGGLLVTAVVAVFTFGRYNYGAHIALGAGVLAGAAIMAGVTALGVSAVTS